MTTRTAERRATGFDIAKAAGHGRLSKGFENREHHITEQLAAAERTNAEANELRAEYERKLTSAKDEVRAILDEAKRDATHSQREILAQARAAAAAEVDRAKHQVEMAKDQTLRELAKRSAQLAVELAGKIIHAQLDPNQHAQLVSEALSRVPKPSAN